MPTWDQFVQFLNTFGVPVTILTFIGIFMWRYGARYIASVEKLHDGIGDKLGSQQALCSQHGKAIAGHDETMRAAALEAFRFFRVFVQREFPNSAVDAKEAFEKLERIIGEA